MKSILGVGFLLLLMSFSAYAQSSRCEYYFRLGSQYFDQAQKIYSQAQDTFSDISSASHANESCRLARTSVVEFTKARNEFSRSVEFYLKASDECDPPFVIIVRNARAASENNRNLSSQGISRSLQARRDFCRD